jgi:hypothetical protein
MQIKETLALLGLIDPAGAESSQNLSGNAYYNKTSETFTEETHGTAVIASEGTLVIPFGGIEEAKRLCVKTSGPCTYKLNALTEAQPLNGILYLSGDATRTITACTVSVPVGDPVTVEWQIFG